MSTPADPLESDALRAQSQTYGLSRGSGGIVGGETVGPTVVAFSTKRLTLIGQVTRMTEM